MPRGNYLLTYLLTYSTPLVGCSLGRSMRSSVLYLVFNFGASVLIIFVNKSLFSGGLRFESACTLNSG